METVNITREGLERDGRVNLSGLGHFDLKWHEARPGRNPQTGEEIEIPAHNTINFKATSDLREYINRKYAHLKAEIIDEKEPEKTVFPATPPAPEPNVSEPVSEYPPEPMVEEKKSERSFAWLWLIIPIIIIILAFLFWPSKKASPPVVEEPMRTKTTADAVEGKPAAPQKSIEKPTTAKKEPVPIKTKTGTSGGIHNVQPGDNLWTIARDFYQQSYLWPNIYRVNLDEIKNPNMLSLGKTLEIPSLQGKPGSLTEKDKKDIAEGFVEVYLVYKNMGKENAHYYLWVVNKWQAQEVIEKFKDQIKQEDLELIGRIDGFPVVK